MAANPANEGQQRAELRIAFLKHLPRRLEQVSRRGRRFCQEGWDINGLSLLHDDVQRMAGVAGRYGELEISQQLHALENLLDPFLRKECLPDEGTNQAVVAVLDGLAPNIDSRIFTSGLHPAILASSPGLQAAHRAEPAPAFYWRRWSQDLSPPAANVPTPAPSSPAEVAAAPVWRNEVAAAAPSKAPPARLAPITKVAPKPAPAQAKPSARIYHLTQASELSLELDQRLEALGYELEIIDDSAELKEVLTALAPDLVIVDPEFQSELESIGAVLRSTRERSGAKLPLLAIANEDSVPVRLTARRAGADALLVQPKTVLDVLGKLQELLESSSEATYRILIVEDDRSQGLFAESILRNAGMEARVVENAFEVLDAMDDFKPDMVLMDLYMPDCDGTELTALIREREQYLHTPIVFLSGESDVDKHYAALDAGGDDFLSKPIRPKHLIAAVSNRVRRSRAMMKRVGSRDPKDAATGLYARAYVLDRINELLGAENVRDRPGGVLFLDLDGISALRDKIGLSGVELLLGEAGALITRRLDGPDFATRFGEGCFLVVCTDRPDGSMESLAVELRSELVTHSFNVQGRPLRLRVAVGVCPFRFGFSDAGGLLNTAERTAREARLADRGVVRFEPPKRSEDTQQSALTGLIREAIERDGFELLFQPIVAVQGGDDSQYQTLLRLRDDQGRLHTAGEIIPLAQRADLMTDVDRWVLSQALRTMETRRTQGVPVRLFVNQAATTVVTPGHAEWISGQLRARNIPGKQLVVELALEEVESQADAVVSFCEALLPIGVQLCLSHFESSSIGDSVLEKLPVDYIKLAPKYLAAAQAQGMRDELRTIIDRAHQRSLRVIAQRVEDAQSAATLWMSGIDFIQGNLVQQAGRELSFDFQAAVL